MLDARLMHSSTHGMPIALVYAQPNLSQTCDVRDRVHFVYENIICGYISLSSISPPPKGRVAENAFGIRSACVRLCC